MMQRMTLYLLLAVFCMVSVVAAAQEKIASAGSVSRSATIAAIDHTKRVVTLKDARGNLEDVYCGPEITRFDELKVGDVVTFSYHAAVAYQIVKAGDKSAADSATSMVGGSGAKPSGTVTQQQKMTVTVEAIDAAAPSVTVREANGHMIAAKVEDKRNLEGIKVGDKVELTLTKALMVTVKSAKK